MEKKILVIEDNKFKRKNLLYYFDNRKLNFEEEKIILHFEEAVNPGLCYASLYSNEICGIILDLGLSHSTDANDWDELMGLEVIHEMYRVKKEIPILIYSTTNVNSELLKLTYKNLKGQIFDPFEQQETVENFIKEL